MMFNRFYNMEMKNTSASAPSANAGSFCAHTACTSHTANTAMIAIMDAIIMASIIICVLIPLAILVSVLAVALFVLVLVLLAAEYHHTPRSRRGA